MTTLNMNDLRGTIGAPPTPPRPLEPWQMFKDPRVIIAGMICGTVVVLGLLGMVGWLVYSERPTDALLLIMTSLLVPLLTAVLAKVTTVQHQTNGTNSRLLDAVGVPVQRQPEQQPAPAPSDQP